LTTLLCCYGTKDNQASIRSNVDVVVDVGVNVEDPFVVVLLFCQNIAILTIFCQKGGKNTDFLVFSTKKFGDFLVLSTKTWSPKLLNLAINFLVLS